MPSSATNPTTLEDEVCMTRARPATTDLPTYGPTFDAMCGMRPRLVRFIRCAMIDFWGSPRTSSLAPWMPKLP